MALEVVPSSNNQAHCLCSSMNQYHSGTWIRSVKRKFDEFEGNRFFIPDLVFSHVARVEIENECVVLREMVSNQQETIQDLSVELEEERNAASTAANEAMSMIVRLQREKAEIEMDYRQFKRFAEEKIAHDNQELLVFEDMLYKRDQNIQSLTCEVQAYKHRMMSYGLTETEAEGIQGRMSRNNSDIDNSSQCASSICDYPPLKCCVNKTNYPEVNNEEADVDKYAFGETPYSRESLKDLEYRINQLERTPRSNQQDGEFSGTKSTLEKVIVGQSPRRTKHSRKFSTDSSSSFFATIKETGSDFATDTSKDLKKMVYSQEGEYSVMEKMDNASDSPDDVSDRVYMIDSVHPAVQYNGVTETESMAPVGIAGDYAITPRDSLNYGDIGDPEIKKLYMRLQALESDRESMRQTILSMGTDQAQLVLLKEIAQEFCKKVPPTRTLERKPSIIQNVSSISVFKWIPSLAFWRKKSHQSKYMCEQTTSGVGLSTLLDKRPQVGQWRCLSTRKI